MRIVMRGTSRFINMYELNGPDSAIVITNNKTGTITRVYFDEADFDKIKDFSWFPHHDPKKPEHLIYVFNNKLQRLHRVIMDPPKDMVVDHINGDTLDNRRSNLRICTVATNNRNRGGTNRRTVISKNNKSGSMGVNFHKARKKWRAFKSFKGKTYSCWCNTYEEAVAKRKEYDELYKDL